MTSALPNLRAVALPLRDLMRGAAVLEAGSRSVLGPAVAQLPQPVRTVLHRVAEAMRSFEAAALIGDPPEGAAVAAVAAPLARPGAETGDPAMFGSVASWALAAALRAMEAHGLLVSETVAAVLYARAVEAGDSGPLRVAKLFRALDAGHAVAAAPGTGVGMAEADRAMARTAILALVLWLITDRPEAPDDEARILSLAVALARATADEVDPAADDAALGAALVAKAGMI